MSKIKLALLLSFPAVVLKAALTELELVFVHFMLLEVKQVSFSLLFYYFTNYLSNH